MYGSPSATTRETGRLTYDDVIMKTGGPARRAGRRRRRDLGRSRPACGSGRRDRRPRARPGQRVQARAEPGADRCCTPRSRACSSAGSASSTRSSGRHRRPGRARHALGVRGLAGPVPVRQGARHAEVPAAPCSSRWSATCVFSLVNVVLMLFSVERRQFGPLRSGWLGVAVGLIAVGLAAASLIIDFDSIKRGVEQGVPAKLAWVGGVRPRRDPDLAVPRAPADASRSSATSD